MKYPLWASILSAVGGPALVAYFANLALKDRDKRLDGFETWRDEHEKEHLSPKELIRMHEENRSWIKGISDLQEKHRLEAQSNFNHVMERIDKILSREQNSRRGDTQ